jgi:hypothetical protein
LAFEPYKYFFFFAGFVVSLGLAFSLLERKKLPGDRRSFLLCGLQRPAAKSSATEKEADLAPFFVSPPLFRKEKNLTVLSPLGKKKKTG